MHGTLHSPSCCCLSVSRDEQDAGTRPVVGGRPTLGVLGAGGPRQFWVGGWAGTPGGGRPILGGWGMGPGAKGAAKYFFWLFGWVGGWVGGWAGLTPPLRVGRPILGGSVSRKLWVGGCPNYPPPPVVKNGCGGHSWCVGSCMCCTYATALSKLQ